MRMYHQLLPETNGVKIIKKQKTHLNIQKTPSNVQLGQLTTPDEVLIIFL